MQPVARDECSALEPPIGETTRWQSSIGIDHFQDGRRPELAVGLDLRLFEQRLNKATPGVLEQRLILDERRRASLAIYDDGLQALSTHNGTASAARGNACRRPIHVKIRYAPQRTARARHRARS